MSAIIQVEQLSKRYLIGHQVQGEGLRHRLERALTAPFQKRKLGNAEKPVHPDISAPAEEFWALRDVSFDVPQGEVVGIIGRNGAGKSTLLKILSRITEPTTGRVTIRGRVASLLEVGTGFHPELTGRENIFLNGAILGMARREIKGRFDEIVEFAEVAKFIDTPVKRYSSGMYVRLAFAVAAHLEPEILIVDEVLAVGDAGFQKKCLGKMKDVSGKEGRTVLFVSHNLTAVRSLCHRAVLLRAGQVVANDQTDEIVHRYQSQDFEESLHRQWNPPKAEEPLAAHGIYLREARLDPEDKNAGSLRVDTPFALSFCVHSRRETTVNLSPHFLTAGGDVVFASPSPSCRIAPGVNWFTSRIPGSFLNDGVYSVQLVLVEHSSVIQVVNDVLVFEVHDLPRDGSWHGKWPGVVRPTFEWHLGPQHPYSGRSAS